MDSSISTSLDGGTIVVGEPYDDDSGTNFGSAYVYDGINWGKETKLTANDNATNAYFGTDVSISPDGSTITVGSSASAAYIFTDW